ncbi:MAG: hypothetical protein CMK09_06535 [Ponticaulis sp.]|nr:hypothetical protein [Ponticaulis sp.]|tara:strand:+ start:7967 stop:8191 length:225 start_codon:yes stop_codon:yes gene_type:complete
MWPISAFKAKLITLTQHTVRQELTQHSINYQAAKNLIDVLEMKVARMETELVVRMDELDQRIRELENQSKSDES